MFGADYMAVMLWKNYVNERLQELRKETGRAEKK